MRTAWEAANSPHQFIRLTRDREALRHGNHIEFMAVANWAEWMARDVENAEQSRIDELFEEELRRYEEHVFGYSKQSENFYDNF